MPRRSISKKFDQDFLTNRTLPPREIHLPTIAMAPSLADVAPIANRQHKKSKNGCLQCKQRKVKVKSANSLATGKDLQSTV